ncbi:MAG: AAA family ATPase [Lachnospiraceae bacterium]|nr:AAA family ATPase [Lachnospiraceae bacterium]
MNIRMAVADKDREYLRRLSDVLQEYEDISLSIYTDEESLEMALLSKRFDLLLFDPSVYDGRSSLNKATKAIMLTDTDRPVDETFRDFAKVRKFQRISRIYKQILEYYAELCGDLGNVLGQETMSVIAFYSPAGGCGKTTTALVAATKLAAQGYCTLYLNLEDMAAEDCYLPQQAEKGLSEVVASLDNKTVNMGLKVSSLLQNKTDQLCYLNHFDSPRDVLEITEEELRELLAQLGNAGLFRYCVVDMGTSLDQKCMVLFENAAKIVLVERPDAICQRKMERFLEQTWLIREYGNKMVRLINFDNGRGSDLQTQLPVIGRIANVHNPDSGQLINALSLSVDVNFVNQLVR